MPAPSDQLLEARRATTPPPWLHTQAADETTLIDWPSPDVCCQYTVRFVVLTAASAEVQPRPS